MDVFLTSASKVNVVSNGVIFDVRAKTAEARKNTRRLDGCVRRDVSVTRYSDVVDRQNVYTNQKEVSL